MYALLFPSAHNFISAVEEKVNVDVRLMGVPTGAATPWRGGSPPWIAVVCGPGLRELVLWAGLFFIRTPSWTGISSRQAPIWRGAVCGPRDYARSRSTSYTRPMPSALPPDLRLPKHRQRRARRSRLSVPEVSGLDR